MLGAIFLKALTGILFGNKRDGMLILCKTISLAHKKALFGVYIFSGANMHKPNW